MGETAPFWRFSAASYPDLEKSMADDNLAVKADRSLNVDASTASRVCMFVLLRRFYMLFCVDLFVIYMESFYMAKRDSLMACASFTCKYIK